MKILTIRLKNLNSLRGEHVVNLADERLDRAGFFAITGPTGAGKSTLLDAITLALYGRAARYGATAKPLDMMSRHTGDCRAEVTFQVKGNQYRASWELRRARGNPDGDPQPVRRTLSTVPEGEILASGIHEVEQAIQDLCGLDYNRFTRSVLLAQGEFAKFLKASPNERSELLESLTQTSIYSQLSQLAHEFYRERERELTINERSLQGIELMDEEERAAQEKDLTERTQNLEQVQLRWNAQNSRLAEAAQLKSRVQEEERLLRDMEAARLRRVEAGPSLAKLARHRETLPFATALTECDLVQKRWESSQAKARQVQELAQRLTLDWHAHLQAGRLLVEKLRQAQGVQSQTAKASLAQAERDFQTLTQWLEQNARDAEFAPQLPALKAQLEKLAATRLESKSAQDRVGNLPARHLTLAEAQDQLSQLLAVSDEDGRRRTIEGYRETKRELDALEQGVERRRVSQLRLGGLQARLADLAPQVKELQTSVQGLETQLELTGKLLASQRAEWQAAQLIASLEQHRTNLVEGESCPLCGALEHPFAAGLPRSQPRELEQAIQETEKSLTDLRAGRDRQKAALAKLEKEQELTGQSIQALEAELAEEEGKLRKAATSLGLAECSAEVLRAENVRLAALLETENRALQELGELTLHVKHLTLRDESDRLDGELQAALLPFGLQVPAPAEEAAAVKLLEGRHRQFQAQQAALRPLERGVEQARSRLQEAEKARQALEEGARPILEKAQAFPAQPVKVSWPDLPAALKTLAELEQKARDTTRDAQERITECDSLSQDVAEHRSALEARLSGGNFPDLLSLRAARLDDEQSGELERLERALTHESQRLEGSFDTCRIALAELRQRQLPEGDALVAEQAELEALTKTLEQERISVAELALYLRHDTEQREEFEDKTQRLAEDRRKLVVWSRLNELIGSASGAKFRTIAQNISLALLIRHANQHLHRLTERYRLRCRAGKELELEIEDLFQAGVTRPMASLSGGESFLASLALALGLSDLAGRNVQIDSLFIDEGFGSLDSDALEVAISALEGLRQSNKTVGVISHVEILKERIATQIAVEKQPNGTSWLVMR